MRWWLGWGAERGLGTNIFSLTQDWEDDARRTLLSWSRGRVMAIACHCKGGICPSLSSSALWNSPSSYCTRLRNHFPLRFADSSLRELCQMRNRSRKKTENRNKEMRKNSAGKYKTRKEEKYMRKDTAKRQTDDPQSFRVQ